MKTLLLPCTRNAAFLYLKTAALFLLLGCSSTIFGQTTVFSDDFATSAGINYTTASGAIGTSPNWNHNRGGVDFGAKIDGGVLTLSNNASGAANVTGWNTAFASTSDFTAPYSSTLASNPGVVTWTFNMRQPQSNPSGFANGSYGVAFILAGTPGTTLSTGTGYAVTLGNSGKIDPVKLVSYSSGIGTTSEIKASNTSGLTDFGNPYISVKVTYTPSTNTWELFVRNDGVSFIDPNTGSLTSQGTAVNSTYTSSLLGIMGGFWNAGTKANQGSTFDNVKVTVVVPTTTSLSPSSAIAGTSNFNLTVNGTDFVSGTSVVKWNGSNRTTTFVSTTQLTAAVTAADILSSGTASVAVANGLAVSNAQIFTIDPAGQPTLTLSTSALAGQSTTTGTASSALTYTITGANLTTDPIVTAPTNFEVSKDGTTYAGSLTLARTGNIITGQPLTLYSRIKASAPAGSYLGSVINAATGATTKNVSVSGVVLSAKPTVQATSVVFSTVTSTSFTANWSNGNGSNRLVLIRSASAVNASPVSGVSYYSNASFGNGSAVGTGNYVVYNGTNNSVTITDLQPATTYFIAVYEFNGGGGTENYFTTTPATGSRATINAPFGWQIYAQNAVNTINFDNIVDGVNNNQFQGDGLGTVTVPGELSSNAFAITGFSDGAIAFGGTSNINTDYERGTSNTSSSVGGLYAFQVAPNNYELGIQPATGDFVPGSATLRFQNQTAAAVTSINIGYKVYVYNDQAAASSFNFSYSADNSAYTNVPGLNVTSPTTADTNPGWKAYYRVVTITGLNIASNAYYHLRWTGATVSGSGAFDAFGLDDIVMVANPTSNFVPFNGIAENFIIQGNTVLNGTSTVNSDITFNGGKVDINANTLSLNGTVTNTTPQGIKSNGASNLIIGGAVSPTLSIDQTTIGTTNAFNNFSINTTAANTVTLSNPIAINGTLTTALNQSLNLGTNALTGTLATITNNGNILTQNTTAAPIPSGKTWGGTGILNFNAVTQQTLPAGTYNNLTISTSGGAVASASATVNGILNLPAANPSSTVGSLSMGTHTLTIGGSGTNTGTGDVSGIVTRNSILQSIPYTFGNTYTSIIFANNGTLPTSMSLKIDLGVAPSWLPNAIKRTYDFIQTGGSATKAVLKAHYLDSELNGNIEAKLVDWARIIPSNTTLEQGRSNYNTTEDWVELGNVNVGLYFASTFGVVSLTLAESAAGALTWNGSVSNSWTTATNWTLNATPSDAASVFIPDAATTPNSPTLNPSVLLGKLDIQAGGVLNAPANSQFTINGGAGAWINNGTYNPGTGNSAVIFTSPDATIAGSTNFNNITVNSGAALRPLTNSYMRIAGIFTNNRSVFFGTIKNTVEYMGTN